MINSINSATQSANVQQVKYNRQFVSYRGNELESSPKSDEFESNKKSGKTAGIVAGLLATAAVVVGGICLHKGSKALEGKDASFMEKLKAGWKDLRGKGSKGVKDTETKPENKPAEETPKADKKPTEPDYYKEHEEYLAQKEQEIAESDKRNEEWLKEQRSKIEKDYDEVWQKGLAEKENVANGVQAESEVASSIDKKMEETVSNIIDSAAKDFEYISNLKVNKCSPEEIKEYSELMYKGQENFANVFEKCTESQYAKAADMSFAEMKEFTDNYVNFSQELYNNLAAPMLPPEVANNPEAFKMFLEQSTNSTFRDLFRQANEATIKMQSGKDLLSASELKDIEEITNMQIKQLEMMSKYSESEVALNPDETLLDLFLRVIGSMK